MKRFDLWYFFSGYVIIDIYCVRTAELIARLTEEGAFITDIKRLSYTKTQMRLPYARLRRVSVIAEEYGAELTISERVGLARIPDRFRRRKPAVIGAAAALALIIAASQMVWSIEIHCGEAVNEFRVYERVKESGVHVGMLRSGVHPDELERFIQSGFAELGYVNVYLSGTTLVVETVDRVMPPEMASEEPGDIVAETDALIERIVPLRGHAVVSEGSVVKKGDVLISGRYTSPNDTDITVAADGEITARVWYTGEGSANLDGADTDAARTAAREAAYYAALKNIPDDAEILSLRVYYKTGQGIVSASGVVEARTRIGVRTYYGYTEDVSLE